MHRKHERIGWKYEMGVACACRRRALPARASASPRRWQRLGSRKRRSCQRCWTCQRPRMPQQRCLKRAPATPAEDADAAAVSAPRACLSPAYLDDRAALDDSGCLFQQAAPSQAQQQPRDRIVSGNAYMLMYKRRDWRDRLRARRGSRRRCRPSACLPLVYPQAAVCLAYPVSFCYSGLRLAPSVGRSYCCRLSSSNPACAALLLPDCGMNEIELSHMYAVGQARAQLLHSDLSFLTCCGGRLAELMAQERSAYEARCAEYEAKRSAEVGKVVERQKLVRRVLESTAVRGPGQEGRCACMPLLLAA